MGKKILTLFLIGISINSCISSRKFSDFEDKNVETYESLRKYISDINNVNSKQELKILELKNTQSDLRSAQIDLKIALSKYIDQINALRKQLTLMKVHLANVQDNVAKLEDRAKTTEQYNSDQEFFRKYVASSKDTINFTEIDSYVLNLNYTDRATENYRRLVSQIVKKSKTPYEKARAIFMWIANNIAYDLTASIYDADDTFISREGICSGYSSLFEKFCKLADLEAVTIVGMSRGITFRKGDNLGSHAWNAVKMSGSQWILIDVTWGAGYINKNVFSRHIGSYWFDTDPSIFVLSHFPEVESWQLIQNALTEEEFRTFPIIYPNIAMMGLNGTSLLEHFRKNESKNHNFPDTHPFGGLLKVNELPLTDALTSGNKYNFSFTAPDNYKIALVQEERWNYFANGANNVYTIEYQPVKGELSINVNDGNRSSYTLLFAYQVE
jgi:hypothetical protein